MRLLRCACNDVRYRPAFPNDLFNTWASADGLPDGNGKPAEGFAAQALRRIWNGQPDCKS